jgi:hypothetical protein
VTTVKNDINVDSNTGDNKASDNTSGDVYVGTGDSNVKVQIANSLNSNVADVAACDCDEDVEVTISGNGTGTENEAKLGLSSNTAVFQNNVANVDNDVDVDANTGRNDAEDNTGGDVVIDTGNSNVKVKTATMANSNTARVLGSGDGSSVKLIIAENGSDSKNTIGLALNRANLLSQANLTSIRNDVDVDSNTGDNEIDDSTGGIVAIYTGNSDIEAWVENYAGFNAADLGCDCMLEDVLAKVWGNGTDSANLIAASLNADQEVFQDNACGYGQYPHSTDLRTYGFDFPNRYPTPCFDNDLDLDGVTGDNDAKDNTGSVDGDDPLIDTGDSDTKVHVVNEGGSNTFGTLEMPEMEMPGQSGTSFSFTFDMNAFMQWLMAQQG